MATLEQQIFRKGSTTYYFSSRFFPAKIREDVFKLYSFVRVADDYVDSVPAQADKFHALRAAWDVAKNDAALSSGLSALDSIDQRVVKNIVHVTRKYGFDAAWVESFLDSMQADLLSSFARHTAASKAPGRTHSMSNTAPLRASLFPGISLEQRKNVHVVYKTLEDTLWYMYGSAEVIGLMMAKIMGLKMCSCHTAESALLATPVRTHRTKSTAPLRASPPPSISSLPDSCKTTITARLQGRAMQFINFLRDIQEDNTLGRLYFPAEDLEKFGLRNLSQQTAQQDPDKFKEFMRYQLRRYSEWQAEANLGFHYIPRRLRIPLQTARDMYNWTATTIATDPLVVFNKKVKPRKRRVIVRGLYNGVIVLPGFG